MSIFLNEKPVKVQKYCESDLDRLHKNIENIRGYKKDERGVGITTSYLYLMLEEFWGGSPGNYYVYVGASIEEAFRVRQALWELILIQSELYYKENFNLDAIDEDIRNCNMIIDESKYLFRTIDNVTFRFISKAQASGSSMRGCSISRLFIDLPMSKREDLTTRYNNIAYNLLPCLYNNGDWI